MLIKKAFFVQNVRSFKRCGRAARNANGHVIMYGDKITNSMEIAINETKRRRAIQEEFNESMASHHKRFKKISGRRFERHMLPKMRKIYKPAIKLNKMSKKEREKLIASMEKEMKEAAKALDFERAAELRDLIIRVKSGRMTKHGNR